MGERVSLEIAAFEVDCDRSGGFYVVDKAVSRLALEEVTTCFG